MCLSLHYGMYNAILKLASTFCKIANEAYEQFREKVERLSHENPYPFRKWFNENGRAYIEFRDEGMEDDQDPGDDKWVIVMLEDAGWVVTDYKAGYAQKGNRTMRIGKIIKQIRREEEAKWKRAIEEAQQRDADEFEIENLQRQADIALDFINSNENQFMNSSARTAAKAGGLMIVISQNPHDVAQMSTGRSWESCMTLGTGGYHSNVYCEVSGGGLIAYLIDANDKEIQHPHARIHIRRFESPDGDNIAVPEQSVYGNNAPGFSEAVQNWINSMQQQMPPGIYERQGGSYSDTFGQTYVVTPKMDVNTPEGQDELIGWVTGERLPPEAKYDQWIVEDFLYENLYNNDEEFYGHGPRDRGAVFMSKEEAERYVEEQEILEETDTEREVYGYDEWNDFDEEAGKYVIDRFEISKSTVDNTHELKLRAARKLLEAPKGTLTPEALEAIKNYAMATGASYLSPFTKDFVKKYPETLSKKDVDEMSTYDNIEYIKSLPTGKQAPYLADWHAAILQSLRDPTDIIMEETKDALEAFNSGDGDAPTIIPGYRRRDSVEQDVYLKFMDMIEKPLRLFDPIPEDIAQELIDFSKQLPSYGLDPDGRAMNNINNSIAFEFGLKKADTPAVQEFLRGQLHRWDEGPRGGQENKHILYAIGRLGENGKSFLPFLKKELDKKKKLYYKLKENESRNYVEQNSFRWLKMDIESILHAIDSIENGTGHSKKYKFHL